MEFHITPGKESCGENFYNGIFHHLKLQVMSWRIAKIWIKLTWLLFVSDLSVRFQYELITIYLCCCWLERKCANILNNIYNTIDPPTRTITEVYVASNRPFQNMITLHQPLCPSSCGSSHFRCMLIIQISESDFLIFFKILCLLIC